MTPKSPSTTRLYLTCPTLWYLRKVRKIEPKWLAKPDAARIIGHGFANGIAHYQLHRKHGVESIECSKQLALACAKAELDKELAKGKLVSEYATEDFDAIMGKVGLAMDRYPAHEVLQDFQILSVERTLRDSGDSRIDLLLSKDNVLSIGDFKVRGWLKADQIQYARQNYANDWNMLHYLHFASKELNEDIFRYHIIQVILAPTYKVILWEYNVHPETMEWFIESAEKAWTDMDTYAANARPLMVSEHSTKYGLCPMYKMCFQYHHDESIMGEDYISTRKDDDAKGD